MELACPHCGQRLNFSGKRPSFCGYCGKSLPPSGQDSTVVLENPVATPGRNEADPAEIGGYRLVRLLGEGGMGRVYEAEEAATGRRVALKLISVDYAASPGAVERFRREGRLASTASHPRCVFVLAADEAAGRPYIVMELMPGQTLQDLVDRDGPLPPEQAIAKILDVIEGLREAHRLGVVHRDVKPSNCFLAADGRVKVGDFGLSKSLVGGAALTRTGTFLGTPLFASPEQIKSEAVGPQSDVYSVAATLYCLLTGRAPFQGGDPAAVLARIVSEAPPPMRSLHPRLSPAIDRVVLRGLERDPAKRWRDLDEFQAALLPFLPDRLSIGGLGVRFGAFLIDYAIVAVLGSAAGLLIALLMGGIRDLWEPNITPERQFVQQLAGMLLTVAYFGVPEAVWGCTPGKRWLRLRVCKAGAAERPGFAVVVLRAALFYLLLNLGTLALLLLIFNGAIDLRSNDPAQAVQSGLLVLVVVYPLTALGIVLMAGTMRARNGYRGLHEMLSGTRVVRLPSAGTRRPFRGRELGLDASRPEGLAESVGPFEVLGVLPGGGRGKILLGNDAVLGRRAWIWLRPADDLPLGAARREVSRTSRLRWLAGGREGPFQWDAFLAPAGGLLIDVVRAANRLTWGEARHLLAQLADELTAAEAEGTLPATLTTAQVWVQPDGRVQLLDAPVAPDAADGHNGDAPALTLLRWTAVLLLEGKPRPADARPAGVRAPLPPHASRILDRLMGVSKPYEDVRAFQANLAATAENPTETTRPRRLAHLAVLTMVLSVGLCAGFSPAGVSPSMTASMTTLQIKQKEGIREQLRALTAAEVVAGLGPDAGVRLAALRQADKDARLDEKLGRSLDDLRREREARFAALDWVGKSYAAMMEHHWDDMEKQGNPVTRPPSPSQPDSLRTLAQGEAVEAKGIRTEQAQMFAVVQTIMRLFWPAVWVIWAFLWRGGLTYRLTGLALVRGNGRPALRIQCLWRAFLVWAPVAGLSVASVWLEAVYWSRWDGGGSNAWMLAAASAAWWAALALLPLYIALAIWRPGRGPHDWLARTYLVPR